MRVYTNPFTSIHRTGDLSSYFTTFALISDGKSVFKYWESATQVLANQAERFEAQN